MHNDTLTNYRKEALLSELTSIDEEIGTLLNRQEDIQQQLSSYNISEKQRKDLLSEQRRNNAHINTYKGRRNELEKVLESLSVDL